MRTAAGSACGGFFSDAQFFHPILVFIWIIIYNNTDRLLCAVRRIKEDYHEYKISFMDLYDFRGSSVPYNAVRFCGRL